MPHLWRLSQYVDLSGEGGRRSSNRWNRRGRPVVYLAESVAGVVLESLVHLMDERDRKLPIGLQLIHVEYPASVDCRDIPESQLASDWRVNSAITQDAGDCWLRTRATALLSVPSAVIPSTRNFLLNPEHPEARLFAVQEHLPFNLDPRLKSLADFARSYLREIRFVSPDE